MTVGVVKTTLLRRESACRSVATPTKVGLGAKIVKSYLGLYAAVAANSQRFAHSDQIGQGPRTHFLHDVPAIDLDGDLRQAELGGYLLVHQAGRDQFQDRLLTRT